MKFSRFTKLIALLLFSASLPIVSADAEAVSKKNIQFGGKLQKEVFANSSMTFLNHTIENDRSFRYRTTLDVNALAQYGDLPKNPAVEIKMSGRIRYDVGTDAIVKTTPVEAAVVGVPITIPASSVGKTIPWLRELSMKISLDENESGSNHYLRFGSFAYELGRGIALGAAYASGGFLGLDPRFSIDQFAPGGLLHTDLYCDSLSMDFYFSLLSNPSGSFKENSQKIREHQLDLGTASVTRGPNAASWLGAVAFHWKAIDFEDCKLNVDPYLYIHPSPDQKLEFAADADSQLYGIGTAMEFRVGKFEWGFDGAFQGGHTNIKPWDRNYLKLVNNNAVATFQDTKVYTNEALTTLAPATTENQAAIAAGPKGFDQNGKQIGDSGLWNANDRFRPAQRELYHGYFFVTDFSYEIIDKQLKVFVDTGISSGQLDDLYDINSNSTEEERMNMSFHGYVPIQSVYSGKRIQHLVMLNTGVPRFTVQNPDMKLDKLHVPSRITGVSTLTDKFTNLAYAGSAFEYKPAKFADQKVVIKPTVFYYWMVQAPYKLGVYKTIDDVEVYTPSTVVASHSLGTALSLELEATLKECINVGGYAGLMLPGAQYKQFRGLQLTGGTLGSNTAYVFNFFMAYKF